jgi:uncharacterized protein (DUF1015 family)
MSVILPFRGYRPAPAYASEVPAPPYDVLDSKEARAMAAGHPHSFLHINKPEIDLPEDVDLYDDRVYAKGRENLQRFIAEGVLVRDAKPCLYVYRQRMGNHVQTGIVAAASCDEYAQNKIKKHEFTRRDKEDDRTRHTDELNANTGPVFLTYQARAEIDALVATITAKKPDHDVITADGFGHTLWVIEDPATIAKLQELFSAIPCTYVADGHHRAASGNRVRELRKAKNPNHTGKEPYNFFMAVFFPHDQLAIMDYNRVVKDLAGMTEEQFVARVEEKFEVVPATSGKPTEPKTFGMFLGGKWYRLRAKPGTYPEKDPVKSLDVSILQDNLLHPILGIQDPRSDKRIDFVGGIRGIGELERRCGLDAKVAFAMFPTSIEELMAIADTGNVMPPKSTWFEPKLRDGMVVRVIEAD